MPSVNLFADYTSSTLRHFDYGSLPKLLQTPSGLAILEIQGTVHAHVTEERNDSLDTKTGEEKTSTQIGRLEFPDFQADKGPEDTKWMKKVHLYVGKHQRLLGEVKRLPKPLVVFRKRSLHTQLDEHIRGNFDESLDAQEQLEIVEIVEHKIIFVGRPEPVGE